MCSMYYVMCLKHYVLCFMYYVCFFMYHVSFFYVLFKSKCASKDENQSYRNTEQSRGGFRLMFNGGCRGSDTGAPVERSAFKGLQTARD